MAADAPVSGAQFILHRLAEEGTRHAFLVPGAHIGPLVTALAEGDPITPIFAAHESGAGFMADGYARMANGPGLCAGIGGPGASNMLTAAVTAHADRSPVLFLTGNVPRRLQGKGAFQDGSADGCRDRALFAQALDHAAEPTCADELAPCMADAMRTLRAAAPRPAHLSVSADVLAAQVAPYRGGARRAPAAPDGGALAQAVTGFLGGVRKLAILAGEEVARGEGAALLKEFAERYQLPVATTLAAKGAMPEDHRLSLGNFGYAGARRASAVLLSDELEALLVLGAELSERDTLCWHPALLAGPRRVLRIAAAAQAPQAPRVPELRIDCVSALRRLLDQDTELLAPLHRGLATRQAWLESLASTAFGFDLPAVAESGDGIHPAWLVHEMRAHLSRETVMFVDSGTHRLYAGHYWQSYIAGGLLTANRTGPMGWAVAAAIGGKLARPDLPVAVLTGDGCMLMHGLEIATAARYRVPLVLVVANNRAYAKIFLAQRAAAPAAAELSRLDTQDWARLAATLGATGISVSRLDQLGPALRRAQGMDGPVVIDVRTLLDCEPPEPAHAGSAAAATPHFAPAMSPLAGDRDG